MQTTLGNAAVIAVQRMHVLLMSHATYEFGEDHFQACGLDFRNYKIAVFKNLMNFRTLLNKDIDFVAAYSDGSTPLRLQDYNWKNRQRPFWPLDRFIKPKFLN